VKTETDQREFPVEAVCADPDGKKVVFSESDVFVCGKAVWDVTEEKGETVLARLRPGQVMVHNHARQE
jgi:hypothetical protein